MADKPLTVAQFLATLPDDRRKAMKAVRKAINDNVDSQIKEGMQGSMISWYVPHKVYPDGYHCNPKDPLPFIALASQKSHIGLYLFCTYTVQDEDKKFREAWKKTGKKLDMGKSCVRFKKLEDVPLDVVGKTIKRMTVKKFIKNYEESVPASKRPSAKKAASKKKATTKKKAASKKKATTKKKTPARKKATKKKTS